MPEMKADGYKVKAHFVLSRNKAAWIVVFLAPQYTIKLHELYEFLTSDMKSEE